MNLYNYHQKANENVSFDGSHKCDFKCFQKEEKEKEEWQEVGKRSLTHTLSTHSIPGWIVS